MKRVDAQLPRPGKGHLRLFLMRHGETERGCEAMLYGHTDVALSPIGIEQSRRLVSELEARPLDAIYSSDLSRAVFAAQMIADSRGLTTQILRELREAYMGKWEGKTLSEVAIAQPEMISCLYTDPSEFRYPEGESFIEVQARVEQALCRILEAHTEGEIAIMTHGGVSRLIIGRMIELPPRNLLRLSQDFGCLNVIDLFDGQPIIRLLNYVPGAGCCLP